MGITLAALDFLLRAHKEGMGFGHTLTLGRQSITDSSERLEAILKKHGLWPLPLEQKEFHDRIRLAQWPFETFLTTIGAEEVSSCDASDFEGANIIHDLNEPIPEQLKSRYDLVIDGGTLEHVFNFPIAIKNAMEMVKLNGHLIVITPANNYFGHGFYQFSPELFYRVLSKENGFSVRKMIALVDEACSSTIFGKTYSFHLGSPWYSVSDPAFIGRRVTLINNRPVMLFIWAQRIEEKAIFASAPQQSDFAAQWTNNRPVSKNEREQKLLFTGLSVSSKIPKWVRWQLVPKLLAMIDPFRYRRWRQRHSFNNHTLFTKEKE